MWKPRCAVKVDWAYSPVKDLHFICPLDMLHNQVHHFRQILLLHGATVVPVFELRLVRDELKTLSIQTELVFPPSNVGYGFWF